MERLTSKSQNIINKYLDYSDQNIKNIINKNRKFNAVLRNKNLTLYDMLIMSAKLGCDGFYYTNNEASINFTTRIKIELSKVVIQNYPEVIYEEIDDTIYIYFNLNENTETCHIDRLNIFVI
jgi:hypothetical protein